MNFSTEEQIKKGQDFLNSVEKPSCDGCQRGVRMCHHTPCVGTVDDMEKLLDAGYAKNLSLDYWAGSQAPEKLRASLTGEEEQEYQSKLWNPFKDDVAMLVPSIVGYEGQKTPFVKSGTCNLLVDGKCSIHHLKPTQGRMACCKVTYAYDDNGKLEDLDERIPILHTWNTQRGKDLIERWKKEVNFQGEDGLPMPESIGDIFDCLLGVMKAKTEQMQEISKLPEVEVATKVFEKPY